MAPRPRRRRKGAMNTSKKWREPLFRQPKPPAAFSSGRLCLGPLRLFPLGRVQLIGQPGIPIRQEHGAAEPEPMLEGQVL